MNRSVGALVRSVAGIGRSVWLMLIVSGASSAWALDPSRSIPQYYNQSWTRQTGLPANGVTTITQTKDGFLWLGTQRGIVRFDGLRFVPIALPDDRMFRNQVISSLVADGDNGLWFALKGGAFGRYDGRGGFSTVKQPWVEPGMNVIDLCRGPDGELWVAADTGFGRIANGSGDAFFSTDLLAVRKIAASRSGRVWLATTQKGLHYWERGKTTPWTDEALKGRQVVTLAVDGADRLWVGTSTGLLCYDAELRPVAIPRLDHEIKSLFVDRHGVLWIGTATDGLTRFQDGGDFTFFKKADGLAHDLVGGFFEDAEGSLWVATAEGLSQLADIKFPIFAASEGLPGGTCHDVSASARGGVWISGSQGLSYFDGERALNYSTEAGLATRYIKRAFEAKDGDVYLMNGNRGIEIFAAGNVVASFAAPQWPTAFAEDERGVVVAIGDRLHRVSRAGLAPYVFAPGPEPSLTWIRNLIVARDGALWVASVRGIMRVQDGRFQQWSEPEGLSDDDVQCLIEDEDGAIWAGLTTGMARLKDGVIRNISRRDGLFDDTIFAIVPGDDGNFWIRSSQGVFRASRENLNAFADGKTNRVECVVFNDVHDVKTIDTTDAEYTGCKAADGRIWFPTPQGALRIDPKNVPTNAVAPIARIERCRANGGELPPQGRIVVPPGRGELEFHFAAPTFIAPHKARFRYLLEGYDRDWVEAENRRAAFYTNLKPGSYAFRVRAANSDGVWSRSDDALSIELRPHFYQTAWFYALCGGVVMASLGGVYFARIRHLERKEQELQKNRLWLESEVRNRTAELAEANKSLHREVEERERAQVELKQHTQLLEQEIEERIRMQTEIERVHRQLLEASHKAGMAEVATGVLHNVGNVLNSVNVSTTLVIDNLARSRAGNLQRVCALLQEHAHDVPGFIANDPKGRQIPDYLNLLAKHLAQEQQAMAEELASLRKNVEHIKDIVAMQQNLAKASGVTETVSAIELVEDALRINATALERHGVEVLREYRDQPILNTERHKVIQILVNLVANAKYACSDSGRPEKRIVVRVAADEDMVRIEVIDNGVGIHPENLTQIFAHGFTTRKHGHGFGLHSCALAAKELGGSLTAESEGEGRGAVFVLVLPLSSRTVRR